MAIIVIALPESGLSGTISVINMATEVEDFSGAISEIGTTKTYKFEFVEVADTDYSFVISVTGYETISGAIFRDTASGGGGGGLTQDEHDHLMGLSQFSGGNIVDRTKYNEDLIKKIKEFEEIIKKVPKVDMELLGKLMDAKIAKIKPVDISGIQTMIQNINLSIEAQKMLLVDVKNQEKQELMIEKSELEVEEKSILDKLNNFDENLKEKDSLLQKKQYDIEEKNKKISELEIEIQKIILEKESDKKKAEETINELLELHDQEIDEKDGTEKLLVQAYIDK